MGILRPGDTCWRRTHSGRVAFLIDAAAYYAALRRALLGAQRSVLILGWDVDSRTRLVPDSDDGYPVTLLPFLNALCVAKPDLHIHVVAWEFSTIYTFEREALPAYRFAWRGHRRLHFALDGIHPIWASHHQKVVVVDDRVAFVGGLDLTIRRWDRPAHDPRDPARTDPAGVIYPPIHDVQMAVDGDTASALGDLARTRWLQGTRQTLRPPEVPPGDPWPAGVASELGPVEIGIARTTPALGARAGVGEILRLNLEAIASARRTIFVENQYLTSAAVGEALARRLGEPEGPEVVLVLPRLESGWLEQSSMGVLRARLLERLRQADRHGRLRILHPVVPGLGTACVNVHSKVLIVDDRLAKVGSANLSNRSMGFDTECDLAIEAHDDPTARSIAGFRARLLGEHLGVAPELVAACQQRTGSLVAAVDALAGGDRTLVPLGPEDAPVINLAVLDGLVCDPEQPIAVEHVLDQFVPDNARPPAHRSVLRFAAALAVLLAVGVAWRSSPAPEWIRALPAAPAVVFAAFVLAALAFVPATLLVGLTALTFAPVPALELAWAGGVVSAALTYWLGRWLGTERLQRWWGARLVWLRGQLLRQGVSALAMARLLPVANFSAVNALAGALRLPFGSFLAGNALGLVPGVLAMILFARIVTAVAQTPAWSSILPLAGIVVVVVVALGWLRRALARVRAVAAEVLP